MNILSLSLSPFFERQVCFDFMEKHKGEEEGPLGDPQFVSRASLLHRLVGHRYHVLTCPSFSPQNDNNILFDTKSKHHIFIGEKKE
jgi:hypothetical protein